MPSSEPRRFATLPRGLAPLGYGNYLLYWLGVLFSNSGRWVELTGGVWLVYDLTRSPVLLGVLGLLRAIPTIVIGPVAGVIADRVDQRRLLFWLQALAVCNSVALALLIASGSVQLWQIYVQVFAQGTIEAFDSAVRQALFPRFVPRTKIVEAVTLIATAGRTGKLLGPAAGGLAIAGFGVGSPFFLSAALFSTLMVSALAIRGLVPRRPTEGSSIRLELVEGIRYILGARIVGALLKMEAAFSLFSINAVIVTVVGREVLDVGPEGLGTLLSAPALGALGGIASLVVVGQSRRQGRLVILSSLAYAIALVGFGLSRAYAVALASLVVAGFFEVLVVVSRQSIMQLTTPGRMRGRVMANMRVVSGGFERLAQTQSGILSSAIGGPFALIAAASVIAATAALTARFDERLWGFTREEAAPATAASLAAPEAPAS